MHPNNKYIKAIEKALLINAPNISKAQKDAIAAYIGTKLTVLGLNSPAQKQLARQNYGLNLEPHEGLEVFDKLFKYSPVFEIKNTALLFVDLNYKKLNNETLFNVMLDWVDHVDNWAHSDYLSKFYSRFIEESNGRSRLLPHLKKWNSHKNKWKRRQSLVALLYYARTKKEHLPFNAIIDFVKPLLNDEEYFVQKGLGWTLRETYNVYPKQTFDFMDRHYHKISSVAFAAACEKMNSQQKNLLKKKRKAYRAKK